jgi:hypothetical protein
LQARSPTALASDLAALYEQDAANVLVYKPPFDSSPEGESAPLPRADASLFRRE